MGKNRCAIFFELPPEIHEELERKFAGVKTSSRELFTFMSKDMVQKSDAEIVEWYLSHKRLQFQNGKTEAAEDAANT